MTKEDMEVAAELMKMLESLDKKPDCNCGLTKVCFACADHKKNDSFWNFVLDSNSVMYWYTNNNAITLDRRLFSGNMLII